MGSGSCRLTGVVVTSDLFFAVTFAEELNFDLHVKWIPFEVTSAHREDSAYVI